MDGYENHVRRGPEDEEEKYKRGMKSTKIRYNIIDPEGAFSKAFQIKFNSAPQK